METTENKKEVSDKELQKVIGDFLEMGHVDNIIAMFRRHPQYYDWTGELLKDERFGVRLGISILFEELQRLQPEHISLAIPSLTKLLKEDSPILRGEATSLLGTIGTETALKHVRHMRLDANKQVREVAELVLEEMDQ